MMRRAGAPALVLALSLAACATWPGAEPATASRPDIGSVPDNIASLPMDDELGAAAPTLRHVDGVWIVVPPDGVHAFFRRTIPGTSEPTLLDVAVGPIVDEIDEDCAAMAYSLARLVERDGIWVRGPIGPERYVTAP